MSDIEMFPMPGSSSVGISASDDDTNPIKTSVQIAWPEDIHAPDCEPQPDPWQPIVLSLDGGGIRGLSSLYIIRELMIKIGEEERLQDRNRVAQLSTASRRPSGGDDTAAPTTPENSSDRNFRLPCHYFDFIIGTSTGGLIAVMLGRLRLDVDICIEEYKSLGVHIFGNWRWWRLTKYDHRRLEEAIKGVVQRHCPEHGDADHCAGADLLRQYDFSHKDGRYKNYSCKVAMVAIREGERDGEDQPYLFRSYDHVEASPTSYHHFDPLEWNPGRVQRNRITIWEACRATSAAPLYFDKIRISGVRYMDGGVGEANNPANYALNEALQMAERQDKRKRVAALVSVGTGHKKAQSRFKNIFTLMQWARKAITDTTRAHQNAENTLKRQSTPYFRFDVKPPDGSTDPGLSNMRLDECKRKKRKQLGKGKAKANGIDDSHQSTHLQNGDLNSSEVTTPSPPRSASHIQQQRQMKKKYNPEKYEYQTYEKIKNLTEAYCAHNRTSIQVENVDASLRKAAKILVWYRRRRERETVGDAWTHFYQHPYTKVPGT